MNENLYRFKLAHSLLLLYSLLVNSLESIGKKFRSRQLQGNRDIILGADTETSIYLVLFDKTN